MAEIKPEKQEDLFSFGQEIKDKLPPIVKFENDKRIRLDFGDDLGSVRNTTFGDKLCFNVTNLDTKEKQVLMISHKGLILKLLEVAKKKKKIGKVAITRTGKATATRYNVEELK
jgi:hypothetical protein